VEHRAEKVNFMQLFFRTIHYNGCSSSRKTLGKLVVEGYATYKVLFGGAEMWEGWWVLGVIGHERESFKWPLGA
jgi:hypothetical protein